MQNIVSETQVYGSSSFLLTIVSVLSILLGIYVIISKNPVISILFLIGLFFTISLYLIIIGLHFIGLSYLLIYIGAVSIFFIFIIMLINIRVSELLTDNRNSIPLAILTVLIFNYLVNDTLPLNSFIHDINTITITTIFDDLLTYLSSMYYTDYIFEKNLLWEDNSFLKVAIVASKSWDSIVICTSHIASIGSILYTNLFMLMIIISLILLLAMIGAIVITMGKTLKN